MRQQSLYLVILLALGIFSCGEKNSDQNKENASADSLMVQSEKLKFKVDTITNQLSNPWGIAFLPDGRILVTERAGEIRIVKDGKLLEEKISGVPKVVAEGQGGLLDIQLHPDYKSNGWIYLSYSKPGEGGAA